MKRNGSLAGTSRHFDSILPSDGRGAADATRASVTGFKPDRIFLAREDAKFLGDSSVTVTVGGVESILILSTLGFS
jgi:hypothetical protein